MRKYLIVFALLSLLLAACRIETNINLDIDEDGSAAVGAEIGFDDEFMQLLGETGASPEDVFTDLPNFDGEAEITERVEGDMTYFGAVTEVEDLSTYNIDEIADGGFTEFSFSHDGKSATLNATLASTDLEGMGGGEFPIDPSMITGEFFSASLTVKMPGTVTEHDADEVLADGTLVWDIPFSGTKTVSATSEYGSSGGGLVLIILLIVLLVGIVAAVVATIVSRRESEKAVAAAAAASASAPSEQPSVEQADDTVVLEDAADGPPAESSGSDQPVAASEVSASEGDQAIDEEPEAEEDAEEAEGHYDDGPPKAE